MKIDKNIFRKDINFNTSNGKVSFYAKETAVLKDKTGYSNDLLIGGLNTNAEDDNTPPTMQLFMNDESFVSGGITNSSPTLIVRLFDENGYPGSKPPWGNLTAIDLNSGKIKWQVPFGEYESLTKLGIPLTGTENFGGAEIRMPNIKLK